MLSNFYIMKALSTDLFPSLSYDISRDAIKKQFKNTTPGFCVVYFFGPMIFS